MTIKLLNDTICFKWQLKLTSSECETVSWPHLFAYLFYILTSKSVELFYFRSVQHNYYGVTCRWRCEALGDT